MKKLIIVCALCILLPALSGFTDNTLSTKNSIIFTPAQPSTATEELPHWFNAFQHPGILANLMDSIKVEYPELLKQVRFLNSLKGKKVKIDFIGMIHYGGHTNNDPRVIPCQQSIEKIVQNKKQYAFICEEGFTVKGKVTMDRIYTDEVQKLQLEENLYKIPTQQRTRVNRQTMFNDVKDKNFGVSRLLRNETTPYIIGGEDRWLSLIASNIIRFEVKNRAILSVAEINDLYKLMLTINKSRSEIATSIAAKHWLSLKTNKRAVVVFGVKHQGDFETISAQYGIDANFIIPLGCN
jgi:hypothetical protein